MHLSNYSQEQWQQLERFWQQHTTEKYWVKFYILFLASKPAQPKYNMNNTKTCRNGSLYSRKIGLLSAAWIYFLSQHSEEMAWEMT